MEGFINITKALSDETRVRALMALKGRELCLCQLIDLFGLSPSTISKHMTVLHQAGLVRRRKQGRWHFYRLADEDSSPAVQRAIDWALASLGDNPIVADDQRQLKMVCRKDLQELSACYRA